jgi:hypothetical protein
MQITIVKDDSGYALPFILMVSFVVTTLLVSLLTIVYFTNLQAVKQIEKKKIDLACYSALQKLLSGDLAAENLNNLPINNVNMTANTRMYGLFDEVTITGKTKNDSSSVTYILGDKVSYPFDNALIISHPDLGTTVAGVTRITGNIVAEKNSFEKGNIFGIRNSNENYLDGKINIDQNLKTKFYDDSLLLNILYKQPAENVFSTNNNFTLTNKSLHFLDSLQSLNINGNLIIQDSAAIISTVNAKNAISIFVHGNTLISPGIFLDFPINIYSDSSVVIGGGSSLKNCIVSSRGSIEINKGCYFEGCQFFSLKNIEVIQSKLEYPSILAIYVNTYKSSSYKDVIELDSSTVNGSLLLVCAQTGLSQNKSKIEIDDSSRVQGLVYSENYVNISGKISGIIYTNAFWFYKDPSEYINWIVNLNLNRQQLNQWFLLPAGFKNTASLSEGPERSFSNANILRQDWIY